MTHHEPPAGSRLRFSVLGSFRVDRDGTELDPGPRLQRTLLAVLVLDARRVVPVDRLIELLWGHAAPAAALASVQAYVSQLRRILEPGRAARAPARVLITRDPGYLLSAEDDLAAWPRPRPRAWTMPSPCGAASRWPSSPPSPGRWPRWPGLPSRAYYLAVEDRIDAWLALGEHAQAAAELEALVGARPLRERRRAS